MWPGMRPATGWMANFTSTPFLVRASYISRTLCCAWATAMPYPGTTTTLLAAERMLAASSAVALRAVFCSPVAAAEAWTWPKAPKRTLENDRFIAFDIMTERMNPDDPSSAPAMMSSLLLRTNPMAAAERPAYEFNSEMTVGMSAPPMGMIIRTPMMRGINTISRSEEH